MECFVCERNLSAYIDDELTQEMRLEVEAHLETCEGCREDYETHLAAWEAAGRLRAGTASEELWKAIESEIQQKSAVTTTEDLALMVRGLAGEVRDLKQVVESLRQDMESTQLTEEREMARERERLRRSLHLWRGSGSESAR